LGWSGGGKPQKSGAELPSERLSKRNEKRKKKEKVGKVALQRGGGKGGREGAGWGVKREEEWSGEGRDTPGGDFADLKREKSRADGDVTSEIGVPELTFSRWSWF